MGIAQKVSRQFTEGVRARGQLYFSKGKVSITSAKPGEVVVAKVRGTETYKVRLRVRNGRLYSSCTCLYFGPSGEPCKHIWATILAADARILLHAAPVRPLRYVPDVRAYLAANSDRPGEEPGGYDEDPGPIRSGPGPDRNSDPLGGYDQPRPLPSQDSRWPLIGGRNGLPPSPGDPSSLDRPDYSSELPRPAYPTRPRGPAGPSRGPQPQPPGRYPPPRASRPGPSGAAPRDRRTPYGQQPPSGLGPQSYMPRPPAGPTAQGPGGYHSTPAAGYGPGPANGNARGPGAGNGGYGPGYGGYGPGYGGGGMVGSGPGAGPAGPRRPAGPGRADRDRDRLDRTRGLKPKPRGERIEPRPKPVPAPYPTLHYVIDAAETLAQNSVVVTLARRAPRRLPTERIKGKPQPKKRRLPSAALEGNQYEPEDWILLAQLDEGRIDYDSNAPRSAPISSARPAPPAPRPGATPGVDPRTTGGILPYPKRFVLRPEVQASLVEKLCKTGRCRLRRTADEANPPPLRWDDARPWRFIIDVKLADPAARRWTWRGALRREEDRMDLAEPQVLFPGLVIQGIGRAARFDDGGVFLWMARLRHEKEMSLPESQQDTMLGRILGESRVPAAELVEGLELEEVDLPPVPCLTVRAPMQTRGTDLLIAEVEFDYDGARVASFPAVRMAVQSGRRRVIRRDLRAEARALERLAELSFRPIDDYRFDPGTLEISPKKVITATRELVGDGWRVEAEGTLYRPASDFKLAVTSNMDWFELDGRVQFGSQEIPLPELLEAARRGDMMISLNDGSIGMLPQDWIRQYGLLADLGTATDEGSLRFSKSQAGLLDSLLANQPECKVDAGFAKVRQELHAFEGVTATEPPPGFQGELRPYQQEGLGWLEYLRKFGFGGILADDMGLGKTVQVLAFLQRMRFKRQLKGPSLIVVPRSLVFNWIQEAAKFTPRLRVLDYTGTGRHALREDFGRYDLIVTTYGTLRSDIAELCNIEFDWAILDEAQAIKNSDSQSAKAARLLQSRHRLAMSGTPIENHLGELWSIFEFLNPGMLGTATVFKRAATSNSGQDEQARGVLARALRPFILRRTKQQVVKDLPDKIEQTLYCDMEPPQRKLYDDLLSHYRTTLLRKDDSELKNSKIEVLEALLRLRQAACHPGLIDKQKTGEPSTKLEMLLPQISEIVDEGHKVLIFSQFTSFLSIVRKRLDEEKIVYEYLDGKTRDRQERVDRFQTDPDCRVFLISLKAGGLGLNLTSAEYVYLLDPWWNPAVEAQAIDRSHRIGQTRTVFAYRLIARDTVEQKILDLQQKKRDLADAILNADNRIIQTLTKDDLAFLLS